MNLRENTSVLFSDFIPGAGSWRAVLRLSLYTLPVILPLAFYLRTYDSCMIKQIFLYLIVLAGMAAVAYGALGEGRLVLPASILPFFVPAFLLLFWNALRFPYSLYPAASLEGFIRQEVLLASFLTALLALSARDLRRTVVVILCGWSATAVFGVVERLGLDPFIWKLAFGEKIASTLGNPGLFAAYQALCLPLLPALVLDGELPPWARALAAAGVVLGSLTLAWTFSPEIIAAVAALAAYLLIAARVLRGSRRIAAVSLAALCVALALGVSLRNKSMPGELRREGAFILETWKGAWELGKTSPWLGSGTGSFRPLYPAFRRPEVILNVHTHSEETAHPQNELLEQWTGGGLPAVLLWLWLFGTVLYKGWRTIAALAPEDKSAVYLAGVYAACVGGVLTLLCLNAARFAAGAWPVFFLAALLAAMQRSEPEDSESVVVVPLPSGGWRRSLQVLLLPAVLLPAWWAVLIFRSDMHHNAAVFLSKRGEWTKAIEKYDQEVWGAPYHIMAQFYKGNAFKNRNAPGDAQKALEQYRFVQTLSPDYVTIHTFEAIMLLKLGRKSEAVKCLEIQTRLDPVWDWPWFTLAGLYREAGQPEKAALAEQKLKEAQAAWERSAPSAGK